MVRTSLVARSAMDTSASEVRYARRESCAPLRFRQRRQKRVAVPISGPHRQHLSLERPSETRHRRVIRVELERLRRYLLESPVDHVHELHRSPGRDGGATRLRAVPHLAHRPGVLPKQTQRGQLLLLFVVLGAEQHDLARLESHQEVPVAEPVMPLDAPVSLRKRELRRSVARGARVARLAQTVQAQRPPADVHGHLIAPSGRGEPAARGGGLGREL